MNPSRPGLRLFDFTMIVVSLAIFALLCLFIVGSTRKFWNVLSFPVFPGCMGMILSAGSIFLLRRRTRRLNETGIFKMKRYPLQPVLFILAYLFCSHQPAEAANFIVSGRPGGDERVCRALLSGLQPD